MDASSDKLLMGAKAIADYLGITRRQAYRLLYDCGLPHLKLGGTVAAKQSSLDRWLANLENYNA